MGRISKKLEAMRIGTMLKLADMDIRFIRKHFYVVLEKTVRELRWNLNNFAYYRSTLISPC